MSYSNKNIFLEGTYELDPFTPLSENGFSEMEPVYANMTCDSSLRNWMEPTITDMKIQMEEKNPLVEENNVSYDNADPDDIGDDENDDKWRRRNGKGHQSKNLEAERKRRKKLNDRLYALRALVPNISKLDRSAILGDAIIYVEELQKQVKDLQIELEEGSDDENAMVTGRNCTDHNSMQNGPKRDNGSFLSDFYDESFGIDGGNNEVEHIKNEIVQQMEPQVEVFQIDGNEFFVKVFCEHKHGGFVRLLEALSSMGFQVINVNATRHTCLVSNIFRVEKKDNETFQADYVRESLLELARNPLRAWP